MTGLPPNSDQQASLVQNGNSILHMKTMYLVSNEIGSRGRHRKSNRAWETEQPTHMKNTEKTRRLGMTFKVP